jgi:hypothetical protein
MAWSDEDWQARHDLIYKCQLSSLYHRKRERFFSSVERVLILVSLLAGATALSDLIDVKVLALLVTLASSILLVFNLPEKIKRHSDLASKFKDSESEIERATVLNGKQLAEIKSQLIAIETAEPAEMSALIRLCQNEIANACGQQDKVSELTFFERHLAQWLDMPKSY